MFDKTAIQYDLIFNTEAAQQDVASLLVQLKTAQDALAKMQGRAQPAANGVAAVGRAAGQTKSGIQNASFQVADFAVQLASGTSAARAMAQQLPQLLGGLGVFGALAGAAVAVVLPLLNMKTAAEKAAEAEKAFDDATAKATKNIELANKPLSELEATYGRLAPSVRESARALADLELQRMTQEVKAWGEAMAAGDITPFMAGLRNMGDALGEFYQSITSSNEAVTDQRDILLQQELRLASLRSQFGLNAAEVDRWGGKLLNIGNLLKQGNIDQAAQEIASLTTEAKGFTDGASPGMLTMLAQLNDLMLKFGKSTQDTVQWISAFTPESLIAFKRQAEDIVTGMDDITKAQLEMKQQLSETEIKIKLKLEGASEGEIARQVTFLKEINKLKQDGKEIDDAAIARARATADAAGKVAEANAKLSQIDKDRAKALSEANAATNKAKADFEAFANAIERGVTPLQKAKAELANLKEEFARFGDNLTPEQLEAYGRTVEDLNEKIEKLTFKEKWDKMAEGIQTLKTPLSELYDSLNQIGDAIQENLATGLTDALMSLIDGTKSAKEAFKAFAVSFLQEITKMIVKATILYAIQSALGMVGGGGGGGLGGFLSGIVGGGVGRSASSFGTGRSGMNTAQISNATRAIPGAYAAQSGGTGANLAPSMNVQVINNSSSSVSTGRDPMGNIRIMINDEVANALTRGGNKIDRALQAGYGLRRSGR